MIKFILHKIKNKLWLTVCLVLGLVFLIAAFSCQPMFKEGSLNRLLNQNFVKYIEDNNEYPSVLMRNGTIKLDGKQEIATVNDKIIGYQNIWLKYLDNIDMINSQTLYKLKEQTSQGSCGSKGNYLSISYMPDILSHIEVVKGTDYEGAAYTDYYPCIISENIMDKYGLVVGEVIDFVQWEDNTGETPKLIVTGIFKESNQTDTYWYIRPNSLENEVFVSEAAINAIISRCDVDTVYYNHATLIDYTDISNSNVDDVLYYLSEFSKQDDCFSETVSDVITSFSKERKSVNIMLWVLELPIFGMVLAFIYMVSGQIIETERNEIAMLKSRGMSKMQVILMYLLQSGILAIFGMLVGIPLGVFLCKLSATATDFLTFMGDSSYLYSFVPVMILYGLMAAVIGIIFILIPVVRYSNVSIVEHKSGYNQGKKMFWEKYFLDVILLILSLYLLYNFNQSIDILRNKALAGNKMDPTIFLDTILFILAFGLLTLRLVHYIVKLVYHIGRKKWKPATYVSFLQITRTFGRQGFISVFMILTVAMGLFNANAARTINRNNEDRIVYEVGADVVLKEKWEARPYQDDEKKVRYTYIEPDYVKYKNLVESGECESVARVIRYDDVNAQALGKSVSGCMVMGINTKEFGETAYLKPELYKDNHWFNWLNAISQKNNGVIISSNLAATLEVEVGGNINFSGMNGGVIDDNRKMRGYVCAIVDAWPGYDQYYYEDGELKERYLIVANYTAMNKSFDLAPYEIWCRLSDGTSSDELYDKLSASGIVMTDFNSVSDDISDMKNSPQIQITNGMFTLGFIIALVLCGIGFLIYWISSIRQRELIFGVYRAMGMSVTDINHMLVNEHIFSTLFAVIAGGGVGMTATLLFIRLFGVVYLPEKHNLGIYIYYELGDIVKLFVVIAVMIIICMLILRKLVRSMNITQALKLGEE